MYAIHFNEKKNLKLLTSQEPELETPSQNLWLYLLQVYKEVQAPNSVSRSWVSFWNFQASVTLLNRLPFCFRFSLKGFIYFAVFECLNSFDFFVSLFFPEPEPDPAQGRDEQGVSFLCRWSFLTLCIPGKKGTLSILRRIAPKNDDESSHQLGGISAVHMYPETLYRCHRTHCMPTFLLEKSISPI